MTNKRRARTTGKPRSTPERTSKATQVEVSPADEVFVVGLGASAGGLEALGKFFDVLPADTGMAFVLIQHLDPTHENMMVPLLASHTEMKVVEAATNTPVKRDHVYIIPPGAYLSIHDGVLRLTPPREPHGARMAFDFFLRSLAEDCGTRAICAVLSGTGSDGSDGLLAVHERGGLVMAQDPSDARHAGMPRSAISTGVVDQVLTVAEMPTALIKHRDQASMRPKPARPIPGNGPDTAMAEIFVLLRKLTAHDFSLYKEGTVLRQIQRRMATASIKDVGDYLAMIRKDPDEIARLAADMLINVTSFFRDAKTFEVLADTVIPELIDRQPPDRPLRVWDAGCSTGEETYSIVMLLLEAIAAARRNVKLQVFASDADDRVVTAARNGLYPESIEKDVSPERLARFFIKDDHGYRVTREMREAVVFTTQDLLTDPPFSRLDLVSCRNVLIYLRPEVQEKALGLFHFALREGGILVLGATEAIGSFDERFVPIVKKQRIFRHLGVSRPGEVEFPIAAAGGAQQTYSQLGPTQAAASVRNRAALVAQQALLEAYAPASVLIDSNYRALHFFGTIERYLQLKAGESNQDIFTMTRKELRSGLRTAIRRAEREQTAVAARDTQFQYEGGAVAVTVSVQPVLAEDGAYLLVSFAEQPERVVDPKKRTEMADTSEVVELEQELNVTRRELERAIRDLEIVNDELTAANEEAMSVNEELQAANEELETSKEELQSLNEELTALNSQLNETVEQQRATANDLRNTMNSSDIATLFLDTELKIRLFTPSAMSMFSVIASDVGRPLADLASLTNDGSLIADARTALTEHVPLSSDVEGENGKWYTRRVLPYRSQNDRVEGVVVTFTDVTERKATERAVEAARSYSESIIDTIRQPLVVLDEQLQVVSASASFFRDFSVSPEETVGRKLEAVDDGRLDVSPLRRFLDGFKRGKEVLEACKFDVDLPPLGTRSLSASVQEIGEVTPPMRRILVTFEDITERNKASDGLVAAKHRAEQANLGKSRFLAAASHDLRQPLQTLTLLQGILAKRIKDPNNIKLVGKFEETLGAMSGMLNTLLDINQLEAGVVVAEDTEFQIGPLLESLKTEFAYHASAKGIKWRVISNHFRVRSDPRLLEQMLRNLLVNAVKYTESGGVLLGCRRRGDKLRIEIWDTGIGIASGQLKSIFEEFHQISNDARERERGLGLGLAIVQRIADLLGHTIDVRSRERHGSVFAIEIPLAKQQRLVRPQDAPVAAEAPSEPTGIVLVIEDDPAVREMLEILFEGEGHRTTAVASSAAALALAARAEMVPDVIVADYNLPGDLTGAQLVALLRVSLHSEIPGIILTGDISTETLRKIRQAGCEHISKPASADMLTQRVQRFIAPTRRGDAPETLPQTADAAGGSQPTIFIVDDDRTLLDDMKDFLQAHGHAVEIFASGSAFLEADIEDRAGCLVVDAVMPGIDGIAVLERLKAEERKLPAIMITGHGDLTMAVQAMKAGATDFLEKPIRLDQLLASIESALELAKDATKLSATRDAAAKRLAGLTPRQRDVMEYVIQGKPNKIIAHELGISLRTVESHRAAVMKRVGVNSLPDLVRLVMTV